MHSPSICIICRDPSRQQQAETVSRQTGLPVLEHSSNGCELQLVFDHDRAFLFDASLDTAIDVDFVEGVLAHRQQFGGGRGQAIARAVGLKRGRNPSVLDITAGLARDAYVLASLGCTLTLVERSPVLFTLVEDGIRRGMTDSAATSVLKNFMNLVNADSVLYMEHMDTETRPDVIYIDPMYPERKKSALVKKDMQILQRLLGKDQDAEKLLNTAMKCASDRVVVKRPLHAEPVGNLKPDTSISSKKTRYDIYLVKNP